MIADVDDDDVSGKSSSKPSVCHKEKGGFKCLQMDLVRFDLIRRVLKL